MFMQKAIPRLTAKTSKVIINMLIMFSIIAVTLLLYAMIELKAWRDNE
jgi:hypothetical protein